MSEKFYYKIGEVSKILDVESPVLRFWEQEFNNIKPNRTKSGQRLYSKKDLDTLLKIKHLLYDKKFTIKGAKKHLSLGKDSNIEVKKNIIYEIKEELEKIKKLFT